MKRFKQKSNRYRTLSSVESMLKKYYVHSSIDATGTDFTKMAERAIQSRAGSHSAMASWFESRSRRKRVGLRVGYAIAGLVVAVFLLRGSFYFAPNWAQMAYASVPSTAISRFLIGPEDIGLQQLAHQGKIQAMDVSASSGDIVVHVVGSYADSIRTTLFLRVEPERDSTVTDTNGSWMPDLQYLTLTDQFGHRYRLQSSTWNTDTSQGIFEFAGVPSWRAALGIRFHLSMKSLQWAPKNTTGAQAARPVTGAWDADWVQVSEGLDKILRPDIRSVSHGIEASLKSVVLSPSATRLTVYCTNATVDGAGAPNLSTEPSGMYATSGGEKPRADRDFYVERVADGERMQVFSGEVRSSGASVTWQFVLTALSSPGDYRLVITQYGVDGRWEFPFHIP